MTSLSTAYVVAPSAVDALVPPTMVNTTTTATTGNGATNVVTSTSLPPGTYFVGGNFQTISTTDFDATDTVFFEISDTANVLTNVPLVALAGNNNVGSSPAAMSMSVTGVLVLATTGTLSWSVTCAFTTPTGKTTSVGNAFYQRIA